MGTHCVPENDPAKVGRQVQQRYVSTVADTIRYYIDDRKSIACGYKLYCGQL